MKPLLSKEFRDKVKRFNKINAIDPAKIVDEGLELCPSGTRDELRAVTDALKHAGYTATDIISEVAAWANRTRAERAELDRLTRRVSFLEHEDSLKVAELETLREKCAALETERDHERESGEFWRDELREVRDILVGNRMWPDGMLLKTALTCLVSNYGKATDEREIALAKAETWKRSRDEWKAHCERAESAAPVPPVND